MRALAPSGGQDDNCTYIILMDKSLVFHGDTLNLRGKADSVTNSAIAELRFPGGSNYNIQNQLYPSSAEQSAV